MQNSKKGLLRRINPYCLVVMAYIISAIAFESTPETARIATLAIYAVFFAGIMFVAFKNKIKLNIYIWSLVLMTLYVYIMTLGSEASPSRGSQIAYWLLTCNILCAIIFLLSVKHFSLVLTVLTANIVGTAILVVRILNIYGGVSGIINLVVNTQGEYRLGGLITNENTIGLFLATAILSCVFFMIKSKSKLLKTALVLLIAVFATMVFLTGSRKATLFAILSVILFLLVYYRKIAFGKKILLYAFIILSIVALFTVIKNIPAFSTIYNRFELLIEGIIGENTSYETDQVRKNMIATGLKKFMENPIFGGGTGVSYVVFGTYSHNNFVEILMSYGMLGFIIYYAPFAILIAKLAKPAFYGDIYAVYFLVYLVLQLALSIGWVNYYDRTSQLMIAAAWGYLYNLETKRKGDLKNDLEKLVQAS